MDLEQKNRIIEQNGDPCVRLLEAAEQLFAQKGFEGASIRDITHLAGCNVAAVNYHFGGKERLYSELFKSRLHKLRDIRIDAIDKVMSDNNGHPSLEQLLEAFSRAFLAPLVDKEHGKVMVQLFCREMYDQQLPREVFLQEMVFPIQERFIGAMKTVCPGIADEAILPVIYSLVGQLVHVIHILEMFQDEAESPIGSIEAAIGHIVKFSTAGVRAFIDGGSK